MVFLSEISRISMQFIQRNANWINSIPCASRWVERDALLEHVTVNKVYEIFKFGNLAMDSRLRRSVIVLDAVEQPGQTPVRISLEAQDLFRVDQKGVSLFNISIYINKKYVYILGERRERKEWVYRWFPGRSQKRDV